MFKPVNLLPVFVVLHAWAYAPAVQGAPPDVGAAVDTTDEMATSFDLSKALEMFHRRGFDLLLAQAAVASAQADRTVAGAVANPSLAGSVGHSGGRYRPSECGAPGCSATAYNVSLSDEAAVADLLSGKRGLRIDVANAALQAARMGRDDARRTLDVLLKSQYLAVAIDAENLRFFRDAKQSYAKTYALFSARYQAGDISEADLVRIETAALEAEQNVDAAAQQYRLDEVSLAFLLGARGVAPKFALQAQWLEQINHIELVDVAEQHWVEIAKQRRPDLQAQRARQSRATASLRLSQRSRVPDVTLNVAYQQQGDSENAIQPPTVTAGLALSLPVFYQYQGEIGRAHADFATQSIGYAKLEAQIVADVGQAYASMLAAHRRLQRMQNTLRHRAARAVALVQLQYEKGAASLLELLDARRTCIAVNQEYMSDLSSFWLALFQLEGAVAMQLKS